ncbi:hypothetical protein, partial [Idiomarina sp.]|uniref:hypothetical protein n=1 Tax=Idiomarina sp. TaxID=1874361 RepID=UPI0025C5C4AF
SVGLPHVRVGHRQTSNKTTPANRLGFFYTYRSAVGFFYLTLRAAAPLSRWLLMPARWVFTI